MAEERESLETRGGGLRWNDLIIVQVCRQAWLRCLKEAGDAPRDR